MKSVYMFAIAFALGAASIPALPPDWLPATSGVALLFTLVMAVLCSHSAKEKEPLHPAAQLLSSVFLKTSRPNAEITDRSALRLFLLGLTFLGGQCSAVFILSML